jgi:hypothetical protein
MRTCIVFLHVTRVRLLGGHRLYLEFNEGTAVEIDLRDELHGEVFEPLRDPGYFRKVRLNPETGTVEWPNGADFAPEFLMDAGRRVERAS